MVAERSGGCNRWGVVDISMVSVGTRARDGAVL
jgi:hypothetical protein